MKFLSGIFETDAALKVNGSKKSIHHAKQIMPAAAVSPVNF
jgi:hypothetical protein